MLNRVLQLSSVPQNWDLVFGLRDHGRTVLFSKQCVVRTENTVVGVDERISQMYADALKPYTSYLSLGALETCHEMLNVRQARLAHPDHRVIKWTAEKSMFGTRTRRDSRYWLIVSHILRYNDEYVDEDTYLCENET